MTASRRGIYVGILGIALVGGAISGLSFERHHTAQVRLAGSEAQTGRQLFRALCVTCHGPGGDGSGGAPILDDGQTVAKYPTISALAGFIQTHMPASDPGILTRQESVDLASWIRQLNHLNPSF